jgi:hypothetical protein
METMFVYQITNTVNGKRYVGQTVQSLSRRWAQHCKSAGCCALNNAIKKYGPDNFSIEAICEPPTTELMNELEVYYIQRYNSLTPNGYNLMTGGPAPRHSEETRRKLSIFNQGKVIPEETRKKMSESKIGVRPSEESCKKMSESRMGFRPTKESRKKMSESKTGISLPEETRKKISRSLMGIKPSEETRKKISLANKGRSLSVEHKQKISVSQIRRLKELECQKTEF